MAGWTSGIEKRSNEVTPARDWPAGGGVVFDSNELLSVLGKLRVRYEDADAISDFGGAGSRAVRLCAMKRN